MKPSKATDLINEYSHRSKVMIGFKAGKRVTQRARYVDEFPESVSDPEWNWDAYIYDFELNDLYQDLALAIERWSGENSTFVCERDRLAEFKLLLKTHKPTECESK